MQTESALKRKSRVLKRVLRAFFQSRLTTFTNVDKRFISSKSLSSGEASEWLYTRWPGGHDTMHIEAPTEGINERTNKSFHVETVMCPTPYLGVGEWGESQFEVKTNFDGFERQKPNWTAYNAAQRQEIDLFDALLKELVETIEEPHREGQGRKRLPRSVLIFSAVMKVYSQLSSRRAQSLLDRAEGEGKLGHAPHYNAISKTLLDESITPILQNLIRLSARPLTDIETDFAVDSSGFRCSNFGAYLGMKHGVKREHNWIKAHICTGVKSNIVTDVKVTDGKANDCPHFAGLVKNTSENFDISEVSADKGYLSRANLQLVGDMGATPYIPFKSHTTEKGHGKRMWRTMYHYFQLHREEFMEHYHKRSNVESTFGAIKMKFGETLKSKDPTAQTNELLCKILAYNITVIIHEMFESGITPDF
ncbi:MAG: IS5 family transposase [Euryarchaeota archaeon]|nr:IS5 family transposase [Euryarchaeota archaeon]